MEYKALSTIQPDRDVLRCLPEMDEEKQSILAFQECFGIAAYDEGAFVGSLWFYRVEEKALASPHAPPWSGWSNESKRYPQISETVPPDLYPILGLSCFHVGRTKALEAMDIHDKSYFKKGIGTNLLQTAVQWARARDYRSIVACGGMSDFPEFNNWAGWLPLKVYIRNSFRVMIPINSDEMVPGHLIHKFERDNPGNREVAVVIRSLSPTEQ